MSNPLISVIVPVYKVEKYLSNCIESVQRQTYYNWELILVDDGSPDNCPQICDEYASHDDRIKVIHKENGRVAKARNAALRVARGEYITFLDSDDFLHKDTLKETISIAEEHNADIVQFGFVRGVDTVFPLIEKTKTITEYSNHTIFTSAKANVIVCAKLFKKEIFVGRLIVEDKYFEDDFTTWKWYYAAKSIIVMSDAYYYYTCNESSTMAGHGKKPNWDFLEAYEERIKFFINSKEEDLEHCSRMQLCKSMVLTYGNPHLSSEEKAKVLNIFKENWEVIKGSLYIPSKLNTVFWLFSLTPSITTRIAGYLRTGGVILDDELLISFFEYDSMAYSERRAA